MAEAAREILVVDDDPGIRRLLRLLLGEYGFKVNVAGSGNDAIKQLRRSLPDLVVLDLMMPGLHPRDVIEEARNLGYQGPVLVLSANYAAIEIGYLVGADDVIEKPFDPDELLQRIQGLLKKGIGAS
jgi:two-component system alkaline phosphatase synthesis response regulator PhoP